MSEMTYATIQPITRRAEQHGGTVFCIFACPVSGEFVNSYVGVGDLADAGPGSDALGGVRKQLGSVLRNALGMSKPPAKLELVDAPNLDKLAMQSAVVLAFRRVDTAFVWDAAHGAWVSVQTQPELSTDFDRQISHASPNTDYDRRILARLLVATANADGKITPEEKALLGEFIDPELGQIDELLALAVPATEEFAKLDAAGANRQTFLMLAWTLALTDRDLAEEEESLLNACAHDLGLSPEQATAAKRYAQIYIMDRMIDQYAFGGLIDDASRETVLAQSGTIGMPRADAERALRHYQARNGLG